MTDEQQSSGSERRLMVRYLGKASTTIIRDTDIMRSGVDAILKDVSPGGIGIVMGTPLQVDESVKVQLVNHVQRFEKQTRGIVRHVTTLDDGTYHIGIQLSLRLTPLDVSLLKMGMPHDDASDSQRWI